MFMRADVQTSGKSLAAIVADRSPVIQLFVGERAGFEEFLHQLLVGFSSHISMSDSRAASTAAIMSSGIGLPT